MLHTPVDIKTGFFVLHIFSIKGMLVASAEAILKKGTNLFNKSTAS